MGLCINNLLIHSHHQRHHSDNDARFVSAWQYRCDRLCPINSRAVRPGA